MKKTTKKLLTLALSTLFVGAGLGGAVATYNALDAKVAAAEEAPANFVDISGEIYSHDWGTCGDYKEAGLYRFWLDADKVLNWADGPNCLNDGHPDLLNYIKVNGKTIKEWRDLYAAGKTNAITWTNMPDNGAAYPHTMQSNIVADVIAGRAIYAPIFVSLTKHGDLGSALDMYIPVSFMPEVNSIEFLKGFEWGYNGQIFGFSKDTKFSKVGSQAGKAVEHANVIETTVTGIDGSFGKLGQDGNLDQFLSFYLGTNDYGDANTVAPTDKTMILALNLFDNILIDGETMGSYWGTDAWPSEQFFGVWGRTGSFSTRWPSKIKNAGKTDSVQEIKILAGTQFPSKDDPYNTVYEVKEDAIFNRQADGSFKLYKEAQVVDLASSMNVYGKWGKGDFAGNMAHIRLNAQMDTTWTGSVNNAKLPATVLENVLVNGKSIAQHNAEYKALIESGAASPITWDPTIGFNSEIADDVNNGRAVYAPIFIKLVNHGAGLAGNTIDIYIPNSYLSASDIKELRITSDFLYETEDYKFTVSDDIIFKSNSLCLPDKYVGEANVPQHNFTVEKTKVEKVVGAHSADNQNDAFLSFFLENSDYETGQVNLSDKLAFLKQINYFDYILIDGVPLGELWNYVAPGEIFVNVWGDRQGTFSTRWPTAINSYNSRLNAKTITVLAGCQFPSKTNPTGLVYEVEEDTVLNCTEPFVFVNEDYLLNAEDITISQAADAGDALEMIAFDITYTNWNSTRDIYDFNYFGDQFISMRKKIFINGVSLWDINTTVNDSDYNYATSPWTNPAVPEGGTYQLFQNPTLITGAGNKLTVYVHKDYLNAMGINELTVTVGENFCHSETPKYVVAQDISAKVWSRPVTVSFDTNGGSIVESITVPYNTTVSQVPNLVPTKAGYEFAGWTANGEAFTADTVVTADTTVTANWSIITYTATVTVNGVDTTIEFTVENRAEKLAEIAAMLPESTMDYTYTWAEALPAELALNNDQAFVVRAVANFTAFDFVMDEYINVTVSEGNFARTEFYSKAGGYIIVDYWMDIIVTVNGTQYYPYEPIPLKRSMESANIITITSATGEEVTDEVMFMAYVQPGADLAIGMNEVDIVDAQAGREAYFTAPMAGTYTFKLAEGEENGVLLITMETDYGMVTEPVELPYTVTMDEYEMITFGVATMNWQSDVIDIVVEAPFATGDIWVGEENTISIPEGKYFFTNVSAFMGGSFVITWTGDITVEINGVAIENGDMVELNDMWTGSNSFLINSINGSAVEATLKIEEYKEPATEITLGDVTVNVTVENFYCAGVEVVFTATEAGEYTLSAAEGEANADVTLVNGNITEWIENLPYSFTLAAGESITFIIATSDMMVDSDEINLVLAKAGADVEDPEQPGTSEDPEEPGTSEDPEEPGTSEDPEEPGTSEEPTDEPTEEPSILDQVKGMIPGCSGVVGGIAGGAAALGLAVVALLKKKEDNE